MPRPKTETQSVQPEEFAKEFSVHAFTFWEFCKAAEEKIKEGFAFDFDSNARHPQGFMGNYSAIMVKN